MKTVTIQLSHDTDEIEDKMLDMLQSAIKLISECMLQDCNIEIKTIESD